MALVTSVVGGWVGNFSKHFYRAPRETPESATSQEQRLVRTPATGRQYVEHGKEFEPVGRMPDDVEVGSAEWCLYQAQESALSNTQREGIEQTAMAYAMFSSVHPYVLDNEYNESQFRDYFELTGKQIVERNGSNVPLVPVASNWEQAMRWLISRGRLQLDQARMDAGAGDGH